tara:strand:- start:291156 stop:292679 length:1524 start_codon:yes stop_codon:yes gene_type:complete
MQEACGPRSDRLSTAASFETTEFRRSFTQETDVLLRRRLIWFISIWASLNLLILIFTIVMMANNANFASIFEDKTIKFVFVTTSVVWFGAYITSLVLAIRKKLDAKAMVYVSLGLIVLDGALGIGVRVIDMPGGLELASFLLAHFIACCLFPWTLRQSMIPVALIACASLFSHIVVENHPPVGALFLTLTLVGFTIPGMFICGMKYSQRMQRATNKFLNQRYGMLRQELAYARQVHEALYPAPRTTGNLRYAYQYEPMQQIGGDYLYTKVHDATDTMGEAVSVVIIDVTGHGIPAALTVNRLHGEIDICFAENPDISPGELLAKLNKYVHLTLAKHSIYATAVCLRVDHDRHVVEYASGGHPPAFIRGVDGSLRDLDPTTFVLGACADEDFDSAQIEAEFMPGDSLVVYTDGAIEARSLQGKMLHIDGLRKLLAAPVMPGIENGGQGQWSERILNEVTTYRGGLPPEDDTLVIEIYRPISTDDRNAFDLDPAKAEADPDAQSVHETV